jgi:catechol 2,3-dioxygenase-like lactoylglutathione lyase family enzyme
MNLNQVTLPVTNLKKCIDFYLKMDFIQIVDSPHYARFSCPEGESTFSLSLEKESFKNGATIYFESKNLDSWVKRLQTRGLKFEQLPTAQSYLWTEAIIKDPSGNKIKLYHAGVNRLNPPWQVKITLENQK